MNCKFWNTKIYKGTGWNYGSAERNGPNLVALYQIRLGLFRSSIILLHDLFHVPNTRIVTGKMFQETKQIFLI